MQKYFVCTFEEKMFELKCKVIYEGRIIGNVICTYHQQSSVSWTTFYVHCIKYYISEKVIRKLITMDPE